MSESSPPTLVTALYNINRENGGDGRKWSEYLAWFAETLRICMPMCIFVSPELLDFVMQNRPTHLHSLTRVYCTKLEDIHYASLLEKIVAVIETPDYKTKIKHPNRVECILPYYSVIQYSKFPWLLECVNKNPFDSTHFFWVDAGLSRFTSADTARLCHQALPASKLIIQHNSLLMHYNINDTYLWDSQCLMCGTMFGGDATAITTMCNLIDTELRSRIDDGWLNNEQILLAYTYSKQPHLFHLVHNNTGRHLMIFDHLFPAVVL
jgi:hypothetical protein